MDKPRVLVHEYVTGGGWPEPELPAGLAVEALAMLRAVLVDLKAWGQVHTTATIDSRMPVGDLPADRLVPLCPDRHMPALQKLAAECNAALVIAPESKGVLGRITRTLASQGVPLLGADSNAVSIAADKWQCYQLFRENAIPTPETYLVNRDNLTIQAARCDPPWVVKPRDGAGAEGVGLAADLESLRKVQALAGPDGTSCLLQPYIPGVHASVSLLSDGRTEAIALSLNEQKMEIGASFTYRGGRIPLWHPLQERALALAQRAVGLIPGLRGYVGVDLVMTPLECYLLEINPRITTSYVGLRQVIDLNLAEAIWQSCCQQRLPEKATLTGTISFGKDGTRA